MPVVVQHLIPDNQNLVTVTEDVSAQAALDLMFEHDFSQLPVVDQHNKLQGMVTSDSILRAVSNLNATPDNLTVSHALVKVKPYRSDEDLSELLKGLRDINAIPIIDKQGYLTGLLTSFDTTEYFRYRAEDIMLAEDVETTIRDLIEIAHKNGNGEIDVDELGKSVQAILPSSNGVEKKFKKALLHYLAKVLGQKPDFDEKLFGEVCNKHLHQPTSTKSFEELTLVDYISLFKNLWPKYSADFKGLSWEAMDALLNAVRQTRNAIAHFREITPQQRKQLKYCSDLLNHHRPSIEETEPESLPNSIGQTVINNLLSDLNPDTIQKYWGLISKVSHQTIENAFKATGSQVNEQIGFSNQIDFNPEDEEISSTESRYAPLAVWLQSQDQDTSKVSLTFQDIEQIIQDELPPSARQHRNWWANDAVSHTQSQQWLEAGWRVSNVNISEERAVFSRINDRQTVYIDFFNTLQLKLKEIKNLSIVNFANPQGRHWFGVEVKTPEHPFSTWIGFSFARRSRLRLETYIETGDREHNKRIFDQLFAQKEKIESDLGCPLTWERLNLKRGARIALDRSNSSITASPEELEKMQAWLVEMLPRLYFAIAEKLHAAREASSETTSL
ncbi:DUF4268 domain-containing protein [Pseudanabaena sp. FACHB-2040]|uniref:DUF4268 domain-containing protein n=1 Tax=Pseudanabaena sp. FACHB-2040 TaxID=2692859 RepID=UPI0016850353|nr:DUF4268 domain-containing protein [Pseudanabaena sp. FACHB-2040]MBD2261135.1 DUF4268 domain-containing protein [Pseudanabaena sp. FACHB-2040]